MAKINTKQESNSFERKQQQQKFRANEQALETDRKLEKKKKFYNGEDNLFAWAYNELLIFKHFLLYGKKMVVRVNGNSSNGSSSTNKNIGNPSSVKNGPVDFNPMITMEHRHNEIKEKRENRIREQQRKILEEADISKKTKELEANQQISKIKNQQEDLKIMEKERKEVKRLLEEKKSQVQKQHVQQLLLEKQKEEEILQR